MADAKKKKAHWKTRLDHLALESLWALRESLLIKGAAAMMVLEDNKKNSKECERLVWLAPVCALEGGREEEEGRRKEGKKEGRERGRNGGRGVAILVMKKFHPTGYTI